MIKSLAQSPLTRLLGICLTLLLFVPQADAQAHDLSKFDPGDYVTGPKFAGKDIKGKVVALEYWGITCPPCIQSIPHTTELAKKYGHDKLIIIANQSWSASDQQTEDVWNKHAKNKMVMVVNGGSLATFKPRSVPTAIVFDHNGKSIWEGHPGMMDQAIADAIANLPEEPEEKPADVQDAGPALIVTEPSDPVFFKAEVRQINAQDRNISAAMTKLYRATERSSRQEEIDEAKLIIAAVKAWALQQQEQAQAALSQDPATAYAISDHVVTLLGKDELAGPSATIVAEIQKDNKLHDQVRATIALRSVIDRAKRIGLTEDPAVSQSSEHAQAVRQIARDLDRITKAYPQTDASKQAKDLQAKWMLTK